MNVAVIVAAGRGERLGIADKVLYPLAGIPAICYSLTAAAAANVAVIVVVAGAHTEATIAALAHKLGIKTPVDVVVGGTRRQDSVLAGLLHAHTIGATYVAVHDGARPAVTAEMFNQALQKAVEHGGATLAVPMVDSLKLVQNFQIAHAVSRDELWAMQTPQAFNLARLLEAFKLADERNIEVTDDTALFELMGWPVAIVEGDTCNVKLTRQSDIPLLEAILHARRGGVFH